MAIAILALISMKDAVIHFFDSIEMSVDVVASISYTATLLLGCSDIIDINPSFDACVCGIWIGE